MTDDEPLTDEELLTFDYERLGTGWTRQGGESALAKFGEIYRTQLVVAHYPEDWCERMLGSDSPSISGGYKEGFESGLRSMAAYLRQGDFLPGGKLYRSEIGD